MEYKLYFLNTQGRVVGRCDLECNDDSSAEVAVAAHVDSRAMELRQGARFITHYPVVDKAAD